MRRQQEEEQKKLQMKIAMEERRLLLAQRNLESIRLIAELLARAKVHEDTQNTSESVYIHPSGTQQYTSDLGLLDLQTCSVTELHLSIVLTKCITVTGAFWCPMIQCF